MKDDKAETMVTVILATIVVTIALLFAANDCMADKHICNTDARIYCYEPTDCRVKTIPRYEDEFPKTIAKFSSLEEAQEFCER